MAPSWPTRLRWVLTCLSLSAPTQAENLGLDLHWQAPPPCPSDAAVREQIAELHAGREGEVPALRALRAEARVTEIDGSFHLDLLLIDGSLLGRRTFVGASCEEVAGAAAVAIALLLRSRASEENAEGGAALADPAPETSGASPTGGTAPARAGNADSAERASAGHEVGQRLRLIVSLPSVEFGLAALSRASVGLGGGLGIERGRLRFVLSGIWRPQLGLRVADLPGASALVGRVSASLVTCVWLTTGPLQAAPCWSTTGHYLSATAEGPGISSTSATSAWLALGPALLGRWRLSKQVALNGRAGLELQTARPILAIDGLGGVEQLGPLEIGIGLGAEWIF